MAARKAIRPVTASNHTSEPASIRPSDLLVTVGAGQVVTPQLELFTESPPALRRSLAHRLAHLVAAAVSVAAFFGGLVWILSGGLAR